jgi:hypothetical protein
MGKRRAYEGHLEHPDATQIGDELAAPPQKASVLLARQRGADTESGSCRDCRHHAAMGSGRIEASAS